MVAFHSMAISKKPLLAFFFFFTTMLLMLLSCFKVNAADSLSFTYGDFTQDEEDLIFQGDAHVTSANVLQLTKTNDAGVPQPQSFGRVLFSAPLRLWQKSTGRLSSFETTINFVLTSPSTSPADGFAFFIAPPNSTIPADTQGGLLGLFGPSTAFNASANQVVAVEFDTFYTGNWWDPRYTHIGIDVNTIRSSATVKWDRKEGTIGTARIDYNAGTKVLSVVSSYPGSEDYEVSYVVDLRTVLPEWVRVGITGASGDNVEVHDIKVWDFSSSLQYTNANNKKDDDDIYIASVV